MTEAKPTPGPWEWSLQGTRPEIGQYHSHRITQKHSPEKPSLIASIQNHPLLTRAEEEANACLIAAAPDLLDSNMNLAAHIRMLGHPDDATVRALLDEADAAIAKAKGQQA